MKQKMAMGGDADSDPMPEDKDSDSDMVDQIMAKRMAEGGMADLDMLADSKPNDFEAHTDDGVSYTDANSGDELSDDQEDMDRRDMVAMIMKSRAKKDRLPNPA
jgi:hypothetical protein